MYTRGIATRWTLQRGEFASGFMGNVKKQSVQGMVAHACNPSTSGDRPRRVDHLRSGVQDQPGQHDETPVSTKKYKKLARHGGGYL